MNEPPDAVRSPLLMSPADTALVVIDVQEKLIGLVPGHRRIVWNIGRLITAAELFQMTTIATEQYPKGLGPTVEALRARLPKPATKLAFSCAACPELFAQLEGRGASKLLVAGIEAHVCVQQSVLDLLAGGYALYVVVDAVGSRSAVDYETALGRMESSGATLVTTETALFELCREAGTAEFKRISQLVREPAPQE